MRNVRAILPLPFVLSSALSPTTMRRRTLHRCIIHDILAPCFVENRSKKHERLTFVFALVFWLRVALAQAYLLCYTRSCSHLSGYGRICSCPSQVCLFKVCPAPPFFHMERAVRAVFSLAGAARKFRPRASGQSCGPTILSEASGGHGILQISTTYHIPRLLYLHSGRGLLLGLALGMCY